MEMMYSEAVKANAEAAGVAHGPYPDSFSDFLTMKIIAAKRLDRFGTAYGANSASMGLAQKKDLIRNLGVRIDAFCQAELDVLIDLLGCSKQEFVLEVLCAGIEQAKEALAAAGLRKAYDERIDCKMRDAGFTVTPSSSEGYWNIRYKGELLVNADYGNQQAATKAMSEAVANAVGEGS